MMRWMPLNMCSTITCNNSACVTNRTRALCITMYLCKTKNGLRLYSSLPAFISRQLGRSKDDRCIFFLQDQLFQLRYKLCNIFRLIFLLLAFPCRFHLLFFLSELSQTYQLFNAFAHACRSHSHESRSLMSQTGMDTRTSHDHKTGSLKTSSI